MSKKSKINDMISHITQKENELNDVAKLLKKDFVGLDEIVDNIVENIKIWYIFPELQIRPTILCLWGLTGVGKTDLIRKMVGYMKLQDRFVEIEMTGENTSTKTIQKTLEDSSIAPEDKSILFLDEFQKFRTINEDGTVNKESTAYSDVWTLLSDGKFQSDLKRKTELIEELLYSKYWKDYQASEADENKDEDEDESVEKKNTNKKERMYKTPVYLARKIKRLFKLEEPIEDIMKWDDNKIYDLYNSLANSPKLYESEPYKKMLIILSGNLDEAYSMAGKVSDSDVDADHYHEYSKKLTIIDIKEALASRFRPEQIARFGNSHIIYPSLSRANYEKIIVMKCGQISKLIYDNKGITINYDKSAYDVIYNNGVFPTQGVRPLLSTITNILSSALPTFIFECLLKNVKNITIYCKKNKFYTKIKGKTISVTVPLVLDKIREAVDSEKKSLVTVHELGHAMVYGLLYNIPPKQICLSSINPFAAGFIIPHIQLRNKESYMKQAAIYMAGRAAEEIVFGENHASNGAGGDIQDATNLFWAYVAKDGFDKFNGKVSQRLDDGHIFNSVDTGDAVEKLITTAKLSATKIINDNLPLFRNLVKYAVEYNKIESEDFIRIFAEHGIKLNPVDSNINIKLGYEKNLNYFLSTKENQLKKYVKVIEIPESKMLKHNMNDSLVSVLGQVS